VAPSLGTVRPPVAITNDAQRTLPCVVATTKRSPSRVMPSTAHGIRHCTPPRAHSDLSIAMMSSAESSQKSWPSFFSW
jgi:hypothetical protein